MRMVLERAMGRASSTLSPAHRHFTTQVEIVQKIPVDSEVNRAPCMLQNPAIVAAKTSGSDVYVFDSTKQVESQKQDICDPDMILRGHNKEGYGLSWSPFKQGYLLSGSHDRRICLWDLSMVGHDKVHDPLHVYEAHQSVVGDVSRHPKNEILFGSVGDDCHLTIWEMFFLLLRGLIVFFLGRGFLNGVGSSS